MRRTCIFAATFLIPAFGITRPAEALPTSVPFYEQCAFGSFRACASVELAMVPDATTGRTYVVLRMRNLQGPNYPTSPNYSFRGVWASMLSSVMEGSRTVVPQLEGSATSQFMGQSPLSFWETTQGTGGWGLRDVTYDRLPMLGCDYDPNTWNGPEGTSGWRYTTCGEGWLSFSFSLGGLKNVSDLSSMTLQFYSPEYGSMTCSTFGTETPVGGEKTGPCTVVTPEPATIALLATGLGGLGLFRVRRRKNA